MRSSAALILVFHLRPGGFHALIFTDSVVVRPTHAEDQHSTKGYENDGKILAKINHDL
jgi:hypothetical protein